MDTQRRSLMLGAMATLALGLPTGAGAASIPLDDFIRISARLCNRSPDALDRDMAQRILQALEARYEPSALRALLQPRARADTGIDAVLAAELRAIWFSGLMDASTGPILLGFQHALAWGSAPFLHVPGTCGGPTGYWSEAPRGQAA